MHQQYDITSSESRIDWVRVFTILALALGLGLGTWLAIFKFGSPGIALAFALGGFALVSLTYLSKKVWAERSSTWRSPTSRQVLLGYGLSAILSVLAGWLGGSGGLVIALIAITCLAPAWSPWAIRCWVGDELHSGSAGSDAKNFQESAFRQGQFEKCAQQAGWKSRDDEWVHIDGTEGLADTEVAVFCQVTDPRPASIRPGCTYSPKIGNLSIAPIEGLFQKVINVLDNKIVYALQRSVENIYRPEMGCLNSDSLARELIVGGSGTGKTIAELSKVGAALANGYDAVVIDAKGNRSEVQPWLDLASKLGVQAHLWAEDGSGEPLNILGGLTVGQKAKALYVCTGQAPLEDMGAGTVYAKALKNGCLVLAAAGVPDVATAVELAKNPPARPEFEPLFAKVTGDRGETVADELVRWLEPVASLLDGLESGNGILATDAPGLTVISADLASDVGRAIVSAVILQARASISNRDKSSIPRLFVLDEAAAVMPVVGEELLQLYAMARTAQIYPCMALQDIAQVGDDKWLQQLVTNCDAVYVGLASGAGRINELLGGTWWRHEASWTDDGIGSIRSQISHTVQPVAIEQVAPWCWYVYANGQWRGAFIPPKVTD